MGYQFARFVRTKESGPRGDRAPFREVTWLFESAVAIGQSVFQISMLERGGHAVDLRFREAKCRRRCAPPASSFGYFAGDFAGLFPIQVEIFRHFEYQIERGGSVIRINRVERLRGLISAGTGLRS